MHRSCVCSLDNWTMLGNLRGSSIRRHFSPASSKCVLRSIFSKLPPNTKARKSPYEPFAAHLCLVKHSADRYLCCLVLFSLRRVWMSSLPSKPKALLDWQFGCAQGDICCLILFDVNLSMQKPFNSPEHEYGATALVPTTISTLPAIPAIPNQIVPILVTPRVSKTGSVDSSIPSVADKNILQVGAADM